MNADDSTFSRRAFLRSASCGFGYLGLASLLQSTARSEPYVSPLAPKQPHFAPRAKRVIFLNMQGGPTAQETFEYKPEASHFAFKQHGQSGLWASELFPNIGRHMDKLCMLHGMHTDNTVHNSASIQLHTGNAQFARPSMGSWTLYGLGTENADLPGFITLAPTPVYGGSKLYDSSFLPSSYQGTPLGSEKELGRESARHTSGGLFNRTEQLAIIARAQARNRLRVAQDEHDPRLNGIIESAELAFRMQDALPEVLDWTKEPLSVQEAYGIAKNQPTESFGRQCLVARRLAEAGVRFIELFHKNWDHHSNLFSVLPPRCKEVDLPIAALLGDLAQRGLLKDTLVIWGGEFGRTPTVKGDFNKKTGGETGHNVKGYTMWLAGGGVKPGFAYGSTDERGEEAVKDRVHLHDFHATLLHLMGLDHEKLTYTYAGRDFRLTDVKGSVVKGILA